MQSISLLTFKTNKYWAFKQMGLLKESLKQIEGALFAKLLGTGSGNGFSIWPDFGTYALLINWNDENAASRFFEDSTLFQAFKQRSEHIQTHFLEAIGAHGSWYGEQPFQKEAEYNQGKLAVLTRARINMYKLPRFWKYVPKASRAIEQAKGLIYTKGVGEWPLIEQATFSIWEDEEAMRTYAYQDMHREIISKVKKENWYKEELFSRFNYLRVIEH